MKPILQALVLADHVYQDVSGKKIIAGTFNRFRFSKTPPVREVDLPDGTKKLLASGGMQAGSPYAYISLTDVHDGTKLRLHFANLDRNEVLFETELTVSSKDRLGTVEIVAPLPRLPIGAPGVYAFEITWQGEILGSWRITVEEMKE